MDFRCFPDEILILILDGMEPEGAYNFLQVFPDMGSLIESRLYHLCKPFIYADNIKYICKESKEPVHVWAREKTDLFENVIYCPEQLLRTNRIKEGCYIIPLQCVVIGAKAFEDFTQMQYLYIPPSVTFIGAFAFKNTQLITAFGTENDYQKYKVTIPNSVTEIGEGAFQGCKHILQLHIPDSVKRIKKYAFNGCLYLIRVTGMNSISKLEFGVFEHCEDLTHITIPDSVKEIEEDAFYCCLKLCLFF